jgi:hypothetical protein
MPMKRFNIFLAISFAGVGFQGLDLGPNPIPLAMVLGGEKPETGPGMSSCASKAATKWRLKSSQAMVY